MKRVGLKPDEVEAKLRELNGNMAAVARAFGCTRQTVWRLCQDNETLRQVGSDLREGMKDNAESALQAAVLRGEAWAVCFFLKCQAKDRGYIERQEHEHSGHGGGPIQAEVKVETTPAERLAPYADVIHDALTHGTGNVRQNGTSQHLAPPEAP